MSITVEDGTGIAGAESYATVAFVDTYWTSRTHDATNSAAWAALTTAKKEGALREATAYLDARYGSKYRGVRRGYVQGLLWPRDGAEDEAGYDLPGLPEELQRAVAELAVRASSARLAPDADRGNLVKRTKDQVGPLVQEIEYVDGANTEDRYGSVDGIMAPLLVPAGNGWSWV